MHAQVKQRQITGSFLQRKCVLLLVSFFFSINLMATDEQCADKWMKNITTATQNGKNMRNENIICSDLNYAHTWILSEHKMLDCTRCVFSVSPVHMFDKLNSIKQSQNVCRQLLHHSCTSSMSANGLQLLLNRCLCCVVEDVWWERPAVEARRITQCTDLERKQQQIQMKTIKTSGQQKL